VKCKVLRVIVAGGRDFTNYPLLKQKLIYYLQNYSYADIEIVSGTARGADQLGERFAKEMGCSIKRFPANWDKYGKRAGYIRNKQMAEYADVCVVFWDGRSRGSKLMIDLAKEYGLPLRVVYY
jgi:hypothetical protein